MKRLKFLIVLWKALKELFQAAPVSVTIILFILLVQGLVPGFTLFLTKITLDKLTTVSQDTTFGLPILIFMWLSVFFLENALSPLYQVLQGNIAEKFTAHINLRLIAKASELPGLDIFDNSEFHDDLRLLQEGASSRPLNVFVMLVFSLREVITLVGLSLALTALNWWLPLIILLGSYPLVLATLRLREMSWNALISSTPDARAMEYESRVALDYKHAAEVRLFGLIPWLYKRYNQAFISAHKKLKRARVKEAMRILPFTLFSIVIISSIVMWSLGRASVNQLTAGSIAIIIAGLPRIQQSIFALIENLGILFERGLYFEKYFHFLQMQSLVKLAIHPQILDFKSTKIQFQNVSFTYPDGRPALHNVSFEILPGETVAIVGENGSGKSTLVKLLLRFFDCSEGQILLDNTSLTQVDLDSWRKHIGIVFQDFGKYAYSLEENIRLSEQNETNNRFTDALEQSGLSATMSTLPQGVHTRLSKEFGGTDLSGGQWQKVAIARALYRNADILILDEPTASLDPRSEYDLFQQFSNLAKGRTTLLITHRLGSVLYANRILVLHQGRLVEEGTHKQLLEKEGSYAELWKMQSQQYQGK